MALPKVSLALVVACSLAAAVPHVASAQRITIDGRLPGVQAQTLIGPNYDIGANLGKQVGNNLFHSFGKFGLVTGETAAFTSTGSTAPISNVISRVTGGSRSDIDGKIQSTIAGANLFLINPSGIVFGPNATVNVSGAFHASTADYIKMSDGAKFQATNPGGSTLSAAPPAAFGFLTPSPAKISVNGSTLGPVPGTLGLVGGPVSISGAATLSAPAGTIHVTSAAGTGEVPVDPRNTSALTVSNFGPVHIKGKSKLDVSDATNLGSGGSVYIRSGALTIDASEINADNYGSGLGGQLVLQADSKITLSNTANAHALAQASGSGGDIILRTSPSGAISIDNSNVAVGSAATGDGGKLSVATGQLSLNRGAALKSDAQGSGNGGPIAITADTVLLDGGAALDKSSLSTGIFSTTSGSGNGGSITIVAGQLGLHYGGSVLACAGVLTCTDKKALSPSIPGAGGAVDVNVVGPLIVDSGASLGSVAFAAGNAGSVSVTAARAVAIDMTDGAADSALGGIGSVTEGRGNAGNVTVNAETATITNAATIASFTIAMGNSGNVSVTVSGTLSINGRNAAALGFGTGIAGDATDKMSSGNAGDVNVSAGALTIDNFGQISSLAAGSGIGGTVNVNVGTLSIVNGGTIRSSTFGSGNGGSVTVSVAGDLAIDGTLTPDFPRVSKFTGISVQANDGSMGDAGNVTVNAGTLSIVNGQISTATFGSGRGGRVNIIVASDIVLSGPGPEITAQSTTGSDAGSITVSAVRLLMNNGAAISTKAQSADGGNITLKISDLVYLLSSKITASVNRETGSGGNITIDPQLVVLNHSSITATAAQGRGGNIKINAGAFIQSADSSVDASSEKGISGTVLITGPRVDVNGALVVLSSELRGRAAVLREACAAYGDRPVSSLVEAGRGGLPQDPEATLPALYIADRDFSPNPQPRSGDSEARSAPLQTTVRLTMRCG